MLTLACGVCADPECLVRARMADRLAGEHDLTVPDADYFVLVECSAGAKCSAGGQMHPACYERVVAHAMRTLKQPASGRTVKNGASDEELMKQMWTNKYTQVRPLCRCSCGNGFFCAELNARGVPARRGADGSLLDPSVDQRKERQEATLREKAAKEKEAKEKEREERSRLREEARQRNEQKRLTQTTASTPRPASKLAAPSSRHSSVPQSPPEAVDSPPSVAEAEETVEDDGWQRVPTKEEKARLAEAARRRAAEEARARRAADEEEQQDGWHE